MRRREVEEEETSSVVGTHEDMMSSPGLDTNVSPNDLSNVNSSVQYNENSTCINAIIRDVDVFFHLIAYNCIF